MTQILGIGILPLACTLIYVIPRTSVLGAILLTGYLGGATAIQAHARNPVFETLFPVVFGVLTWGGLYLRFARLRGFIPLRSRQGRPRYIMINTFKLRVPDFAISIDSYGAGSKHRQPARNRGSRIARLDVSRRDY